MLRFLIFCTAFSQIFLNRFGIQITSDFSLAPSYLFLYATLAFAWVKGFVRIDFALLMLFAGVVSASLFSFVYGRPERSFPSLGLYWFVYFPFVFRPINPACPDKHLCRLYYPLLLILAEAVTLNLFVLIATSPVTPRVPAIEVLPEEAVILNLFVFTETSPMTPRVLDKEVAGKSSYLI